MLKATDLTLLFEGKRQRTF